MREFFGGITLLFLLTVTLPLPGQEISIVPRLAAGFYPLQGDSDSFTRVTNTDDGHIVEMFLADDDGSGTGSGSHPPFFSVRFSSDTTWMLLRIDDLETTSERHPIPDIGFTPFDVPLNIGVAGASMLLPPRERVYGLVVEVLTACGDCAPGLLKVEYSILPAPDPLPGDFNHDDSVDVKDFAVLRMNYGREHLFWKDGDANLDGKVDFPDFLLLSANFGAVREPSPLAAVPEPAALPLLASACLGIGLLRRRRQHQFALPIVTVAS